MAPPRSVARLSQRHVTRHRPTPLPPHTAALPQDSEDEKLRYETEIHRLVTTRDRKYTNFVEFQSFKLIYRRYAGLCVVRPRTRPPPPGPSPLPRPVFSSAAGTSPSAWT